MAQMLILSTSVWSMTDEITGEKLEGVTLQIAGEPDYSKPRTKGMQPTKVTAPLSALPDIKHVPAYYEIEFNVIPGAGGKAKVEFSKATFVKPLDLDFHSKPVKA